MLNFISRILSHRTPPVELPPDAARLALVKFGASDPADAASARRGKAGRSAAPGADGAHTPVAPAAEMNVYESAVKRRCRQIAAECIPAPEKVESRQHEVWLEALSDELAFWYLTVALDGWSWAQSYQLRLRGNFDFQFPACIAHFPEPRIRCLEVGTGAMSALGTLYPGKEIELYPTDALADAYRRIFADFGVATKFPVIQCDAEKLANRFEENFFHFAHASNCLDHCYDPAAAIQAMYRLVRPSGSFVLAHHINVAEAEHYTGLHQWNLCPEDGKVCLWNKQGRLYVEDILPAGASFRVEVIPEQNWFTVYIQKAGG